MEDLMRAKDILGAIKKHKEDVVPADARTRREKGYIGWMYGGKRPNDFCSYAERKDNGNA